MSSEFYDVKWSFYTILERIHKLQFCLLIYRLIKIKIKNHILWFIIFKEYQNSNLLKLFRDKSKNMALSYSLKISLLKIKIKKIIKFKVTKIRYCYGRFLISVNSSANYNRFSHNFCSLLS